MNCPHCTPRDGAHTAGCRQVIPGESTFCLDCDKRITFYEVWCCRCKACYRQWQDTPLYLHQMDQSLAALTEQMRGML